jgi:hypothetical protein
MQREIAISQLQSLGKKQSLKGIELAKAKALEAGYTNKQVEHLVAGPRVKLQLNFIQGVQIFRIRIQKRILKV